MVTMYVHLSFLGLDVEESSWKVCIFAYGQTGSGKSWTMEGGQVSYCSQCVYEADHQTDETAGLIPRAIDMIFTVSSQLRDRGWKYQMEGQFLEVYNEVVSSPGIQSEMS